MKRKNITIREDQAEWVEQHDVNLSRRVQQMLDEAMEPDDEELARAYRENAEHAAQVTEQWSHTSLEANERLGEWNEDEDE